MEFDDKSEWVLLGDGVTYLLSGTMARYTVKVCVQDLRSGRSRGTQRVRWSMVMDGWSKRIDPQYNHNRSGVLIMRACGSLDDAIASAKREAQRAYRSALEHRIKEAIVLYAKLESMEKGQVSESPFLTYIHDTISCAMRE